MQVIKNLWQILEELDPHDQGLFVKFVTSVSKPPLLGFQYLRPPMTIRFVPVDVDEKEEEGFSFKHLFMGPTQKTARLPTAATCFNTLKVRSCVVARYSSAYARLMREAVSTAG